MSELQEQIAGALPAGAGGDITRAVLAVLETVGDPKKAKAELEKLAAAWDNIKALVDKAGLPEDIEQVHGELRAQLGAADDRHKELDKREAELDKREAAIERREQAYQTATADTTDIGKAQARKAAALDRRAAKMDAAEKGLDDARARHRAAEEQVKRERAEMARLRRENEQLKGENKTLRAAEAA